MHHDRTAKVLSGTPAEQAAEAVALLAQRGALTAAAPDPADGSQPVTPPRRPAAVG